MPGKFGVSLTHAKENSDRATVAFVVANAAVASDKEALVFLDIEAAPVAKGLCRCDPRRGIRPAQGTHDELRQGRGQDLGVLALLQEA